MQPDHFAQIAHAARPPVPSSTAVERVYAPMASPPPQFVSPENFVPHTIYSYPDVQPVIGMPTQTFVPRLVWVCASMLLFFGLIVTVVYYKQRLPALPANLSSRAAGISQSSTPSHAAATSPLSQQAMRSGEANTGTANLSSASFPLPTDYGVYALSNNSISELKLLSMRVPDGRIAMSAPVSEPSRTTLPNGALRFVIFRRDLVANAPDRIEIRVVARVVRALTFDAKGRPGFAAVSDSWNIRNISYDFRVRSVAGNPEMLLAQPEKPDFVLPAGRYVLVLKGQGYDFTVGGDITDLAQCLERTDAANGSFYSGCLKF